VYKALFEKSTQQFLCIFFRPALLKFLKFHGIFSQKFASHDEKYIKKPVALIFQTRPRGSWTQW